MCAWMDGWMDRWMGRRQQLRLMPHDTIRYDTVRYGRIRWDAGDGKQYTIEKI